MGTVHPDETFQSAEALERLKRGDEAFWEQFVRHFTPPLLSHLGRFPHLQPGDREDILQEVWIVLHAQILEDKFKVGHRMFSFLARIATNRAIDDFRKAGRACSMLESYGKEAGTASPLNLADPALTEILVRLQACLETNRRGCFFELLEHLVLAPTTLRQLRRLSEHQISDREEQIMREARRCLHRIGIWADSLG